MTLYDLNKLAREIDSRLCVENHGGTFYFPIRLSQRNGLWEHLIVCRSLNEAHMFLLGLRAGKRISL